MPARQPENYQKDSSHTLLDPRVLAHIKDYRLLARMAARGFLAGAHRSLTSGQGSEFLQYRDYIVGEDLKFVDWKLYARSDRLLSKRFVEHTQANCYLLVDTSASMDYTGEDSPCSKLHYATMLCAAIAWLARHQGDSVGLITYNDEIQDWLPPASDSSQLDRILKTLYRMKTKGKANHKKVMDKLSGNLTNSGIVVLLSDMIDDGNVLPGLFRFSATRGYEGVAMQILDEDEIKFPFSGSMIFEDLETRSHIRTNPQIIRKNYLTRFKNEQNIIASEFALHQTEYFCTKTCDDLALALSRYFDKRRMVR